MIELHESDRARIYDYIAAEPEMNQFIYGDVESFGVEGGPVTMWALPGTGDAWDGVLLRYMDYYLFYSQRADFDVRAAAAFLKARKVECLSGKLEILRRFAPFFPEAVLRPMYMCRCNRAVENVAVPAGMTIRRLEEADVDAYLELMTGVAEFAANYSSVSLEKRKGETLVNMRSGGMIYGVFDEKGRMVSTASTSGANRQSAMIVGVATREDFRGRGCASAAVANLCADSLRAGRKFLCLFYDNPAAGRIYHRVGLDEVGE